MAGRLHHLERIGAR